ncbi:MAG: hypothetical protein Q4B70_11495 [Lachnospiraceae bacterium]|nr:hypothetical protein [Lachnospiraceae bacterium]
MTAESGSTIAAETGSEDGMDTATTEATSGKVYGADDEIPEEMLADLPSYIGAAIERDYMSYYNISPDEFTWSEWDEFWDISYSNMYNMVMVSLGVKNNDEMEGDLSQSSNFLRAIANGLKDCLNAYGECDYDFTVKLFRAWCGYDETETGFEQKQSMYDLFTNNIVFPE